MNDLIKEKLKEIQDLCELTEEKYQIKPKGFLVDNYLRIQDDITQHNVIAAPKQIKLSEIVSKLKEIIVGTFNKVVIKRIYDSTIVINNKNDFNRISEDVVNINSTKKIVWVNHSYMYENCKWLYALWLAGTEIIDDLEKGENKYE